MNDPMLMTGYDHEALAKALDISLSDIHSILQGKKFKVKQEVSIN